MHRHRTISKSLRTLAIGVAAASMLATTALPASAATSPNLLKNGTAEAAAGGTGGTVSVPGWTRTTGTTFTAVKYGTPGFPSLTAPAPPNRGKNFFAGGNDPNFPTIVAVQSISLGAYVAKIKAGGVTFTTAGWFGGRSTDRDMAFLEIDFKNGSGALIGSSTTVGGVTAANRGNKTELLHRLVNGAVPKGARSVYVQAIFERIDGAYNDGYADNVTLVLNGV